MIKKMSIARSYILNNKQKKHVFSHPVVQFKRSSAVQFVHSTARLISQVFLLGWASVPADPEEDS